MDCRPGCGACCIAPSIRSPIPDLPGFPGSPTGKPAGARCPQLTADNRCRLFGRPERPAVCGRLQAEPEMCGANAEAALRQLTWLETETLPERTFPSHG